TLVERCGVLRSKRRKAPPTRTPPIWTGENEQASTNEASQHDPAALVLCSSTSSKAGYESPAEIGVNAAHGLIPILPSPVGRSKSLPLGREGQIARCFSILKRSGSRLRPRRADLRDVGRFDQAETRQRRPDYVRDVRGDEVRIVPFGH